MFFAILLCEGAKSAPAIVAAMCDANCMKLLLSILNVRVRKVALKYRCFICVKCRPSSSLVMHNSLSPLAFLSSKLNDRHRSEAVAR